MIDGVDEIEELYAAIRQIERRIGTLDARRLDGSITGELKAISHDSALPKVQMGIPVIGNKFQLTEQPKIVGDSFLVNGYIVVDMGIDILGREVIEEWRDVSFIGKECSINCSPINRYNGKFVSATYFYSSELHYSLSISNEFLFTKETTEIEDDIIIRDLTNKVNMRVSFSSSGEMYLSKTRESTLNDVITDEVSGDRYEIHINNGFIEIERIDS